MNESVERDQAVLVQGLVKRYGSVVAVTGLNLSVEHGELVAILGPNGAGKTTTLEIIEGLRQADGGEVLVLGQSPSDARWRVGVQLQEGLLYEELTCAETLRHFARLYGCEVDAEGLLALVGLDGLGDRPTDRLSGGQKRRLQLALALCNDPELIVLDEPTTGLDPVSRHESWTLIRSLHDEGRTILLTTHYIEEAEALADRVIIVDHGTVVTEGTPQELIASLGNTVTIELSAPADAGLTNIAGVSHASHDGDRWQLRSSDVGATLVGLIGRLGTEGLRGMTIHGATLEDVFMARTGHAFESDGAA